MKKIIIALMVLSLIIVGCQSQQAVPAPQEGAPDSQSDKAPVQDTEKAPVEDSAPAEQAPPEAEPVEETQPEAGGEQESLVKEIEMEAFQFGFEPSTITVNKGQKVRITAKSTDVAHGIGIPEFGVSEALPPGEEVTFEFTPDKTGTFRFYCNVYCGSGHSSMEGKLVVVE